MIQFWNVLLPRFLGTVACSSPTLPLGGSLLFLPILVYFPIAMGVLSWFSAEAWGPPQQEAKAARAWSNWPHRTHYWGKT